MKRTLSVALALLLARPALAGADPATPIVTALLPDNVVYWHLASFTPQTNWSDLAAQLDSSQTNGVIIDLRENASPADEAGSAQVLALFPPSAHGHGPVIVLIDRKISGAANLLAIHLQSGGALLIGALSKEKNPKVPVPDIAITMNDREEAAALALIDQGQVLSVITPAAESARLSEASLLRGDDPEQDAALAAREKKGPAAPAPVQDVALLCALDSLKAIALSQHQAVPVPVR